MWTHPLLLLDEWLVVIACGIVWVSCALRINALARSQNWLPKLYLFTTSLAALGILWSPFLGVFNRPNLFHLIFFWAVAFSSIWQTRGYWCELPMLTRRHQERDAA